MKAYNDNIDNTGLVSVADVIKFRDDCHKLVKSSCCEYSHLMGLYDRIGEC